MLFHSLSWRHIESKSELLLGGEGQVRDSHGQLRATMAAAQHPSKSTYAKVAKADGSKYGPPNSTNETGDVGWCDDDAADAVADDVRQPNVLRVARCLLAPWAKASQRRHIHALLCSHRATHKSTLQNI